MIPNRWYAVLESKEVRQGRPLGATRMNRKLVFWRDRKGAVQCVADTCVHRGVALSTGKVIGDSIQCPFHGLEFAGSGACTLIPANGKASPIPQRYSAPSFPVRDEHGFIWLWWGEARDAYPPVPFFDDIDGSFSSSTLRSPGPLITPAPSRTSWTWPTSPSCMPPPSVAEGGPS